MYRFQKGLIVLCFFLFSSSDALSTEHFPVVFVHGYGVNSTLFEMLPFRKLFEEEGFNVFFAETSSIGSLESHAATLRDEIEHKVPEGPYHLVAHSMGGLDARLAIDRYNLGDRCRTLTTVSTPHRGSPVADFIIELLQKDGLGWFLSKIMNLMRRYPEDIHQLTTHYVQDVFNKTVFDDPRIAVFSMGFSIPRPLFLHSLAPILWIGNEIIRDSGFPNNDGLVSLESARWGEYLGDFEADHYSQVAPIPFSGSLVYKSIFRRVLDRISQYEDQLQ